MKTIMHLEKEDIKTQQMGFNYNVVITEDLILNFTADAMDELISDIKNLRNDEKTRNSIGDDFETTDNG